MALARLRFDLPEGDGFCESAFVEMLQIAEAEVKVGGRFRVQFHTPDGERHSVSGVYREIVPDRKLVFSWAWQSTPERESQVTVDLRPDGESTILTLTHEQFFNETARDDHRRGWTLALDNLEKVFP